MSPIRILVVDDSAFMRLILTRRLSSEPDFEVVGTATNGAEAVQQVQALRPDVVTMDVEMPGLDGLGALAQIMAVHPTPVIMVSSLTQKDAETTIRALTLGAVDFVGKPTQMVGTQEMVQEVAAKIRLSAGIRVRQPGPLERAGNGAAVRKAPLLPLGPRDAIFIIGSSTGGPRALRHLMAALPGDANAAGVIVQHMPAGFTRSLAVRLDEISAWNVREAGPGSALRRGQVLMAPGGYHLTFNREGDALLTQTAPVNCVRPSVDVTLRSVVEQCPRKLFAVILTGMGKDGAEGALLLRHAGGRVIAEAESTCAVFGMPRSAIEMGAADAGTPLPEIPTLLYRWLKDASSD